MHTKRLMGTTGTIAGAVLLATLVLGPPATAAPDATVIAPPAASATSTADATPTSDSLPAASAPFSAGVTPAADAPPAASAPPPVSEPTPTTDDPIAHDPTLIKQGAYYYVIITGDAGAENTYLPMKRSKNLKDWEELGPVFTAAPQWIVDTLGTTPADFWAPEIVYAEGRYRLYYSASQFATNNSVIALVTNATLDPSSPDYEWVDEGLVLRSTPGDASTPASDFNAIDPDATVDADGRSWLAYGSFWSGLSIRELDGATGKLIEGGPATPLLDRQWAPNAVEAPAITRHGDFYYLFASFDYCCRGADSEYRTVVGRSADITGPYVDKEGQSLLSGGGTELLRGYNEFAGPGGGDIVSDGRTTGYVHHYYDLDDDERPKLSLRQVVWTADGWPTLSEPLVKSDYPGHGPAYFSLVEKTSRAVVGTVPGGPVAPRCGYEGADIRLLADAADPCAAWRIESGDEGFVALRNLQTNKVVEAAGCETVDGTDIAQWGWLHNDCQQFAITPKNGGWVSFESKAAPGKVVDGGATCIAGSDAVLWSTDASRCQQFRLQPNGPVLIVGAESGTPVSLSCSGRQAGCDKWRFQHTSDGYYRLSNGDARATSVDSAGRTIAGCRIVDLRSVRECLQWRLVPVGDGDFQLAERVTGRVLAQTDGGIRLQRATDAAEQRFRLLEP